MYLIVWNPVRMTMATFAAAPAADVSVWRVSFLDTVRWLLVTVFPPPTAQQLTGGRGVVGRAIVRQTSW